MMYVSICLIFTVAIIYMLAESVESQLKNVLARVTTKRNSSNIVSFQSKRPKVQYVSTKTPNLDICGTRHKDVRRLRSQMILCDNCDQWHHYVCVDVMAKSAEDIDFVCPYKCTSTTSEL